jgi:preprotein translocase subunit SecE
MRWAIVFKGNEEIFIKKTTLVFGFLAVIGVFLVILQFDLGWALEIFSLGVLLFLKEDGVKKINQVIGIIIILSSFYFLFNILA